MALEETSVLPVASNKLTPMIHYANRVSKDPFDFLLLSPDAYKLPDLSGQVAKSFAY
jgi:hypothetical protein